MAVDPSKKSIILVVHGVQIGDNSDLNQDEEIKNLIKSRQGDRQMDFDVDLYKYENLSDDALDPLKKLTSLIISSPVGDAVASSVIELAGDVIISLSDNSTANKIRQGLKNKILEYYQNQQPLYIVAHSLGTVYAFDVVNELISDNEFYDRDDPLTWPVQGMVTMGSPLGLSMFRNTGRNDAHNLGGGSYSFSWRNYYDVSDPVVSGNIFGEHITDFQIAEDFQKDAADQGWFIKDFPVSTGKSWLLAHTAYWEDDAVGDGIISMMV